MLYGQFSIGSTNQNALQFYLIMAFYYYVQQIKYKLYHIGHIKWTFPGFAITFLIGSKNQNTWDIKVLRCLII